MASYGSGFAQGMGAGSNLVSNAYGVYRGKKLFDQQESDRASREGAIGSLFDENNYSAQQGQDVAQYEQERANLLEGGYQPNEAETQALDHGQQNLETTAPSTLFFNKITGMGSQERLGHMVELFQGNGGKVNEASLGALKGVNSLFDNAKTQDQQFASTKAQEEQRMAMAEAYRARARVSEAEANNPNAGRGAPSSVQEYEYFIDNGGEGSYKEFLQGVKRNSQEMNPYQEETINLRKQQHEDRQKQAREKSIKYLSENMDEWENLSGEQREQAINYYSEKLYLPKVDEEFKMFGKNKYSVSTGDGETKKEATPQQPAKKERQIVRTGTKNGKKVVQYDDGTVEYAE